MTSLLILIAAAAAASWLLTGLALRLALAGNILDLPNQRSSHHRPTPRGGGLGLALAFGGGVILLRLTGQLGGQLFWALAGGLPVALVGGLDDLRPVPARRRALIHLASALWLVWWLPPSPYLQLGPNLLAWGAGGYLVSLLGVVWLINSYNFMDGIDGLAASEGLTATVGGALIAGALMAGPEAGELTAVLALLAAALLGFLPWNWPPAKIFMGDVSSGFLGYLMGVFWLAAGQAQPAAVWWWPLLLGVFLVDATLTLGWRLRRRQNPAQAHRDHSYQYAARRYGHRRVTAGVIIINVVWLWPLAWAAAAAPPALAWAISLGGLAPLAAGWRILRAETPAGNP